MSRRFAAMLLPLAGCLAPWGNSMRSTGDSPLRLGNVASALWVEDAGSDPASGRGYGELLLTSEPLDCADWTAADFDLLASDGFVWEESGIYAAFSWSHEPFDASDDGADVGWEGTYWTSLRVETNAHAGVVERELTSLGFADGTVLTDDAWDDLGAATVTALTDETVTGTLKTAYYEARFSADNCGRREAADDTWDTWTD